MYCLMFYSYDAHNDTSETMGVPFFFKDLEKAKKYAEEYYGSAPKEWRTVKFIKKKGVDEVVGVCAMWEYTSHSFGKGDKQFASIRSITWED